MKQLQEKNNKRILLEKPIGKIETFTPYLKMKVKQEVLEVIVEVHPANDQNKD